MKGEGRMDGNEWRGRNGEAFLLNRHDIVRLG
jgi:hypothetical protein